MPPSGPPEPGGSTALPWGRREWGEQAGERSTQGKQPSLAKRANNPQRSEPASDPVAVCNTAIYINAHEASHNKQKGGSAPKLLALIKLLAHDVLGLIKQLFQAQLAQLASSARVSQGDGGFRLIILNPNLMTPETGKPSLKATNDSW